MGRSYAQNQPFKAASGRHVTQGEDGTVTFEGVHGYLAPQAAMDAEELFQAKRDRGLGRWRWPENPDYVVYPMAYDVRVLCERDAFSMPLTRVEVAAKPDASNPAWLAARAYFEAHPEPKPWEAATPGEVWVIQTTNVPDWVAVQVTPDREFRYNDGTTVLLSYPPIIAARRVWPEVAA